MTTVALFGNPNTGKTTLFNELTDKYAYVGNWTGVTVEKKLVNYAIPKRQSSTYRAYIH
ncbi:hypothetical protein LDI01_00720 [Lentilactobacillus diolivorans]|uniref:FeoB-type G domain-containing protein n=2 Tax=Lentilactobacillus diolivorans TaxID=179838 RepID=A0A0R1SRM7_9LACO|nr:hypothetical protein FC85_GL002295 [Lentilactobacillus diolivorans DSM 14421]GEP22479.1 hypothetical protein LDI01_00720 [Lentilactobacillus diolivorans]